jgi:hypothetical protein
MITRHIWEDYIEKCEDIRLSIGMKELYSHRKETIERIFGTAKENHGFRYTQMIGKARMEMKVGLTFACMNLKKLAGLLGKRGLFKAPFPTKPCGKTGNNKDYLKIRTKIVLGLAS